MGMAELGKENAAKIRKAIYGTEIRELLAQIAEIAGFQVDRVNSLITENPQPSEVVDARQGYDVLLENLLAKDKLILTKADQSYIATVLATAVSGAPKDYFYTLNALKSYYPEGADGIFLVLESGHIYIWNGEDWADAGKYQSSVLPEQGIYPNNIFGSEILNVLNPNSVTNNKIMGFSSNLYYMEDPNFVVTDYIIVRYGQSYTIDKTSVKGSVVAAFFDAQKNYLSHVTADGDFITQTISVPAGAAFMRVNIAVQDRVPAEVMIPLGTKYPDKFISYLKSKVNWIIPGNDSVGKDELTDEFLQSLVYKTDRIANVLNPETATIGSRINYTSNVTYITDKNWAYSDFIPVKPGESYTVDKTNSAGNAVALLFDENKNYLGRIDAEKSFAMQTFTISNSEAAFMRVNVTIQNRSIDQVMVYKGDTYPTDYTAYGLTTFYENLADDVKKRLYDIKIPQLYFPSTVYALKGETVELFYRGLISAPNPYNYFSKSSSLYNQKPRKLELSSNTAGEFSKYFIMYHPETGKPLFRKDYTLKVVDPANLINPDTEKNVLMIGDSLTDNPTYPSEVERRITQSDGTPTGLGLSNYKFIGTRSDGTNSNEGRAGYTWTDYLSAPEVKENPFWNPNTNALDFVHYMNSNGFTGDLDYVTILLGHNDVDVLQSTNSSIITKAKTFIDALHRDYPNCKMFLVGLNPTSPYNNRKDTYATNKVKMELSHMYEMLCLDPMYSDFLVYVPATAQFDAEYNMQHTMLPANSRTAETVKTCIDDVHPADSGYFQFSDALVRAMVNHF
jgi:lysophospholipase L1-like esterase